MAKLPINISLINNAQSSSSFASNINLSINSNKKTYSDLVRDQSKANIGVSVVGRSDWSNAWKQQQRSLEARNLPKEDHTDPTPLLIDVISSLPLDSSRRRNYENLKLTIDGTATNVGNGLDTMSRESYRDLLRLSKQSEMIYLGMHPPRPLWSDMDVIPDLKFTSILGTEEGQYVSNIQNWKPIMENAGKPVSDALGSHIDTDASIAKDASGPASFLPAATSSLLDNVSPQLTNEVEGGYKKNQLELMQHLPSKVAGNLRQLSTAQDSILSVPFEIASDVYNGLRKLITQLSDLLDGIKTKVTKWFLSAIGGLVDGLFPEGILDGLIDAVSSIANEFGELFDMLGGFSIVNSIRDIMSNIISGNFMAAFGSIAKLANLLMSGIGSGGVLGGFAGSSVNCIEQQIGLGKASKLFRSSSKNPNTGIALAGVIGSLPSIAAGLGNLGSTLIGGLGNFGTTLISGLGSLGSSLTGGTGNIGSLLRKGLGSITANIRNLGGIIAGILPMGLGFIMSRLLGKLCSVGVTGNAGYSIGSIFDNSRNQTFGRYMTHYASHASIISPLFNKQSKPVGAYAIEDQLIVHEDSSFVPGSQTTKGVTAVGPGGSTAFRPFSVIQVSPNQSFAFNNSVSVTMQGQYPTVNMF